MAVIGPTGRNFAAGMSGGIAYVLDRDGRFADRCNQSLVALDPVGVDDEAELQALLEEHAIAHGLTGRAEVARRAGTRNSSSR